MRRLIPLGARPDMGRRQGEHVDLPDASGAGMLEGDLLAVPSVETADIIVPADRYSVYYRIPIADH